MEQVGWKRVRWISAGGWTPLTAIWPSETRFLTYPHQQEQSVLGQHSLRERSVRMEMSTALSNMELLATSGS